MITILNKKLLEKQRVEPLWSLWGTHRALFYNVNATVSFENRLTLSTKTFFTGLTNWQTDRQAKTILNSFAHACRIMKPNVYKMIHIANIQCTLVTSTPVFVKEMAEVHCILGDSGILLNTIWRKNFCATWPDLGQCFTQHCLEYFNHTLAIFIRQYIQSALTWCC